ncbi:MAG: hypothetical protein IH892_19525 [Planctomycetes bacterium]|nr:hypothetical protein [Planctomycetota bacterium]
MSGESHSLIDRARAGDRAALERLLVEQSDPLCAHIARGLPARLQSTVAAEDVMQETLTQAFLGIGWLRDASPQTFATWLRQTQNRRDL